MIIKVCGLREPDNIRAVESLKVDWMGFIFYPQSPRYVSVCPDNLPVKTKRIGVFVNASQEEILQRVQTFRLDGIQLHGHETPDFCRELRTILKDNSPTGNFPFLVKAFSIHSREEIMTTDKYQQVCDYLLFDTPTQHYGGSGESFDWTLLEHYQGNLPFLLSGGIGNESIATLATFHHPRWVGIDLNSRFEDTPGHKDILSLKTFIQNFKNSAL